MVFFDISFYMNTWDITNFSDNSLSYFLAFNSISSITEYVTKHPEKINELAERALNFICTDAHDSFSEDLKLKAWFFISRESLRKVPKSKSDKALRILSNLHLTSATQVEAVENMFISTQNWRFEKLVGNSCSLPTQECNKIIFNELNQSTPNFHVIKFFLSHANLDSQDKDGNTFLHLALSAPKPSLPLIELLLKSGADPNKKNTATDTPLIILAKSSQDETIARVLIDKGADTHLTNRVGNSPLHYTVTKSSSNGLAFLETLLLWGADTEQKNLAGLTPLLVCLSSGQDLAAIELLVSFGAQLDTKTKFGETPLHFALAAYPQDPKVIEYLIAKGADLDASTAFGIPCSLLLTQKGFSLPSDVQRVRHDEEVHARFLLANSWNVGGESELDGQKLQYGAGGLAWMGEIELMRLFNTFCKHPDQQFNIGEFQKLYETGKAEAEKSKSDIIKSFKSGKTLCFSSGWKGHIIEIIIHNDHMMIVNRGEGFRSSSAKLYKIDRSSSSFFKGALDQILNTQLHDPSKGQKFFYEELPLGLGFNSQEYDITSDIFNNLVTQKPQKENNCWWINPKSGIFGLLALTQIELLEKKQLNSLNNAEIISLYKTQVEAARLVYKEFSLYTKVQILKEYLASPNYTEKDHDLIQKIITKLQKKWPQVVKSKTLDHKEIALLIKKYDEAMK